MNVSAQAPPRITDRKISRDRFVSSSWHKRFLRSVHFLATFKSIIRTRNSFDFKLLGSNEKETFFVCIQNILRIIAISSFRYLNGFSWFFFSCALSWKYFKNGSYGYGEFLLEQFLGY